MKLKKFWIGLIIFIIGFSAIILFINIQISEEENDMEVDLLKVLHRCDDDVNWVDVNIAVYEGDPTEKVEGAYSLNIQASADGGYMEYTFDTAKDISQFTKLCFWNLGLAGETTGRVYLFTDAGNYAYWNVTVPAVWTLQELVLTSPDSETGTLDLTNITKFRNTLLDKLKTHHIDYIYVYLDITSDIIHPLSFIEHSVRDYPRAEFMAKGTWIPEKDDIITIKDYYTSNGSSVADQVIFEGSIIDYELTSIRKIWCESRAKRDLDEFRPSGDYNGDLDSNHIKTLIAECSYITEGTIDATTGNTDNTFKGDKTFRTILNDWADKHYKHWYLSPTGALTFNDADIDSGEDFDQDDKIWNVKPKKHVDSINWVMLLGALVSGVQIEAESKDEDSIEQLGAKIYKDTYSIIMVTAQLQIAADNLRTREQLLPLAINYWYYRVNKGLIQVGETVTFAHSKMNPAITSRQVILNKVIYRFLSGHTNLQTTDGISFVKDKDKSLPQENSQLLQQKDKFVWLIPEPTAEHFVTADFTDDINYNDLDLSSIIPVGATSVLLKMYAVDNAAGSSIYFRRNGQTSTFQVSRLRTQVANIARTPNLIVGVDSDRKCEISINPSRSNWTSISICVLGYWI